jgi:hypothetical protein
MVIEKFGSIEQSQMVIFDLQEYLFDYWSKILEKKE